MVGSRSLVTRGPLSSQWSFREESSWTTVLVMYSGMCWRRKGMVNHFCRRIADCSWACSLMSSADCSDCSSVVQTLNALNRSLVLT